MEEAIERQEKNSKASSGSQLRRDEGTLFQMCQRKGGGILKREKKNCVLWKLAMVAEKGKGVDVISEILHQVIRIYRIELYEIANLIYIQVIFECLTEREERSKEKNVVCVLDSGNRRVS